MTDETSSDTLRERLDEALSNLHDEDSERPSDVAEDAIEYAAQLEAERDRLHDALERAVHRLNSATDWAEVSGVEGELEMALERVERGDAVEQIRREGAEMYREAVMAEEGRLDMFPVPDHLFDDQEGS